MADARLSQRASTHCYSNYTAANGLSFQTYCGNDFPCPVLTDHCSLGRKNVTNMADCMESCASDTAGCYGISYSTTDSICYLKGNYSTTKLEHSNSTMHSALANTTQLQPLSDLSCPYQNLSLTAASQGMQFEVFCGVEWTTGAYCQWNGTCNQHASSLAECLDLCEEAHPLCTGVSWNPDMSLGYGNCHLKSYQLDGSLTVDNSSTVIHSAKVTLNTLQSVNGSLPYSSWNASNGVAFDFSKFDVRSGASNYTAVHFDDFHPCMEYCAQRVNQSCVGILFDMYLSDGYDNCYLLDKTGVVNTASNYTFAGINQVQTTLNQNAMTTASSANAQSNSLAWVAGPVIGGVVLVAAVVALVLVIRRKRQSPRAVHEDKHISSERSQSVYGSVNASTTEYRRQHGRIVELPIEGDMSESSRRLGRFVELPHQSNMTELPGDANIFELSVPKAAQELAGRHSMRRC